MRRGAFFDRRAIGSGWWLLLIQGLLFIALAVLVIYQPAVVVSLVAAMLAVLGVFCTVLAFRIRRMCRTTYRYWSEWWWADVL
jgi:uncharacterized membrane protein HdeD (DUF308 family)